MFTFTRKQQQTSHVIDDIIFGIFSPVACYLCLFVALVFLQNHMITLIVVYKLVVL